GIERHVGEAPLHGFAVVQRVSCIQGAHAAGDVEADAASGHYAVLPGIEGRDAAHGETVSPVGIRHGVHGGDDARQPRHVGRLYRHFVVHGADESLVAVDDHGHAHVAIGIQAPARAVFGFQSADVHSYFEGQTCAEFTPPRLTR